MNQTIIDFFLQSNESGELKNYSRLFSEFTNTNRQRDNNINFTRAGYINTIVTRLLNKRPKVFADYIYNNEKVLTALLNYSNCSSVANIF